MEFMAKKARLSNGDDSGVCDLNVMLNFGIDDLMEFLENEGFDEQVVDLFVHHQIDGSCLAYLTEDRLQKMGIDKLGVRLRLLQKLAPCQLTAEVKPTTDGSKIFQDPIHGPMELHPLCVSVIDTPQFQRLRNLKQVGACYQVFPGASHNRFEHSLGVCHLAGMLVQSLRMRQPELGITNTDVLCVMIAGLCHDLGHGPLSHMFDRSFIPRIRPGCKWKHEQGSIDLFDYLIEKNHLEEAFEKYGVSERDIIFIKEVIAGPKKCQGYQGRAKDKHFLYEIVANQRNGIDVDKMDYFARDCHHLGIRNSFDHLRYMQFTRVLKVGDHREICSRDKEARTIYDMFYTRMSLHRQAYSHKTNRIIETMLIEALIEANDHIFFQGENKKMFRMSEAIEDMEAYTKLTDSVLEVIKLDPRPELAKAQEILHKVECRHLYKCIGQTSPIAENTIDGTKIDKTSIPDIQERIANAMTEQELDMPPLPPQSYVVHLVSFDYGMKDKNPIDAVYFYTKTNPNQPIRIRKNEVSNILPDCFQEVNIRVYCTSSERVDLDVAIKCFQRWCATVKVTAHRGGSAELAMTPFKPTPCKENSSEDLFSCSQRPTGKAKRKLQN